MYAHGGHHRKGMKTPESGQGWELIILTKCDTSWRGHYTKEKGSGLLVVINCGKINIWGKGMEDKDLFSEGLLTFCL